MALKTSLHIAPQTKDGVLKAVDLSGRTLKYKGSSWQVKLAGSKDPVEQFVEC